MARYQSGRGFYGNQVIGAQTTLGDLTSMNRADMGFKGFWQGRPELGAGIAADYDWRNINRPGIKEGSGPWSGPKIPSPMRGAQKVQAAMTPGMTNKQYKRWDAQVGEQMTYGGLQRDPYTGKAATQTDAEGNVTGVTGGSLASQFTGDRGASAYRGSNTTTLRRANRQGGGVTPVPGMATTAATGSQSETIMGYPDPFATPGTPSVPTMPTMTGEEQARQSLYGLASDIEGDNPGAVRRGMAAGVRKIGAPGSKVSTPMGAVGAVVGSTARSVGSAAVGKVGEAVKNRWGGGAKPPGSQFPKPDDLPF